MACSRNWLQQVDYLTYRSQVGVSWKPGVVLSHPEYLRTIAPFMALIEWRSISHLPQSFNWKNAVCYCPPWAGLGKSSFRDIVWGPTPAQDRTQVRSQLLVGLFLIDNVLPRMVWYVLVCKSTMQYAVIIKLRFLRRVFPTSQAIPAWANAIMACVLLDRLVIYIIKWDCPNYARVTLKNV